MAGSISAIDQLQQMCGLEKGQCAAALQEAGGDIEKALAALIDGGKIKTESLDPESVSLELWERSAHRDKVLFLERTVVQPQAGMVELYRKRFGSLPDDYKTAEMLAAEDEEKRRKRFEEGKKLGLDFPGDFPTLGMQARDRAKGRRRDARIKANPITLN